MFVRNLDGPSLVQVIPDDIFIHVTSNAVCASHFFPHSNLAAIPQFHRNQQVYWFSIRRVRLHPTEAVHRMSLVPWVSRADWQLRPLEQGVKVKGVVCRSLVRNLDGPSLVQVILNDILVHVTSNAICASHLFPHSNFAAKARYEATVCCVASCLQWTSQPSVAANTLISCHLCVFRQWM